MLISVERAIKLSSILLIIAHVPKIESQPSGSISSDLSSPDSEILVPRKDSNKHSANLCSVNGEFKCTTSVNQSPLFTQCSNYRLVAYRCAENSYCVQKGFGITCEVNKDTKSFSSVSKRASFEIGGQSHNLKKRDEKAEQVLPSCSSTGPEFSTCSNEGESKQYKQCIDGKTVVSECVNGFVCFNNGNNGILCAYPGYNPKIKSVLDNNNDNPGLKGSNAQIPSSGMQLGLSVGIGIDVSNNLASQNGYQNNISPPLPLLSPTISVLPTS
ncbi:hypothetical protein AYI69_g4450, partial [Smittium culicis]